MSCICGYLHFTRDLQYEFFICRNIFYNSSYDKTIIHSKNSTLRIVFFNENQKFKDKIVTKLIDLGCESEVFNVNFYAINIPIQVDIEEIYLFLDEYVETDDLDYDTGYLAQ